LTGTENAVVIVAYRGSSGQSGARFQGFSDVDPRVGLDIKPPAPASTHEL